LNYREREGSNVEYPLFYAIIPQIITKNKQQWQENQELNWQDIIILLIVTDHRSDVLEDSDEYDMFLGIVCKNINPLTHKPNNIPHTPAGRTLYL
jgi:hypothetical protein